MDRKWVPRFIAHNQQQQTPPTTSPRAPDGQQQLQRSQPSEDFMATNYMPNRPSSLWSLDSMISLPSSQQQLSNTAASVVAPGGGFTLAQPRNPQGVASILGPDNNNNNMAPSSSSLDYRLGNISYVGGSSANMLGPQPPGNMPRTTSSYSTTFDSSNFPSSYPSLSGIPSSFSAFPSLDASTLFGGMQYQHQQQQQQQPPLLPLVRIPTTASMDDYANLNLGALPSSDPTQPPPLQQIRYSGNESLLPQLSLQQQQQQQQQAGLPRMYLPQMDGGSLNTNSSNTGSFTDLPANVFNQRLVSGLHASSTVGGGQVRFPSLPYQHLQQPQYQQVYPTNPLFNVSNRGVSVGIGSGGSSTSIQAGVQVPPLASLIPTTNNTLVQRSSSGPATAAAKPTVVTNIASTTTTLSPSPPASAASATQLPPPRKRRRQVPDRNRGFNTGHWNLEERVKFEQAVEEYGTGKWILVARRVGTRSTEQCRSHAQKWLMGKRQRMQYEGGEAASGAPSSSGGGQGDEEDDDEDEQLSSLPPHNVPSRGSSSSTTGVATTQRERTGHASDGDDVDNDDDDDDKGGGEA